MTTRPLRLGTRASALARWQANWVATQLAAAGVEVELVLISTHGDVQSGDPIGNLGSPGVFTKEIQRALLEQRVDLAVHSLKDLPTETVSGLCLAAVPKRESPRDVLITREGQSFAQLPAGAAIGTGSLRRRAQLLHARRDLMMRDIRGNVDTRLEKLAAGQFDAIVLAEAGLKRLQLDDRITEVLDRRWMLPAVGQGALGIETREDDATTRAAIANLNDRATHQAVLAERALLAALSGGCLAPIAAWAREIESGQLQLDAAVLATDGSQRIAGCATAPLEDAWQLGISLAESLIAQGADRLIAEARVSG
jgi:hydroxymethylbilane synthase